MKRTEIIVSASKRRNVVRWGLLMALGVGVLATGAAFGVGAKKASATASTAVAPSGGCGDRYNALLLQAKAALVKGDRNGAVRSLIAARSQLRDCQGRERLDSAPASALGLNDESFEVKSVCS